MNAPDENPDPLLRDVLADEELDALRRASLDQGLGTVRRTRQVRRLQRAAMLALLPVLLTLGLLWHGSRLAPGPSPIVAKASSPSPTPSGVKTISDEELFALFPNRSLALIGQPGHQELVLLKDTAKR